MGERRGTKGLELWCRRMTEGYPGVQVNNMTTSWRDGLAFCAIIHHFRPDLIDFSKLNKDEIYQNNRMAFEIAERHLGIPALLEPDDMVKFPVPDRLSILTYLSQYYQRFVVAQGTSSSMLTKRPLTNTDIPGVSPTTSNSKVPEQNVDVVRRKCCTKCDLPVAIVEHLIVNNHLYHQTCFTCVRCQTQLMPGFYNVDAENQFCCETCPDEESSDQSMSSSINNEDNLEHHDPYSNIFETALEDTNDAILNKHFTLKSDQLDSFTQARSQFIATQLEDAPDLRTSICRIQEPPDLLKFVNKTEDLDLVDHIKDSVVNNSDSINNSSLGSIVVNSNVSDSDRNQPETANTLLENFTKDCDEKLDDVIVIDTSSDSYEHDAETHKHSEVNETIITISSDNTTSEDSLNPFCDVTEGNDEEYPDDLNPFGNDSEPSVNTSLNPFDSDDDVEETPRPMARKRISVRGVSPVDPYLHKLAEAVNTSLNPFDSDDNVEEAPRPTTRKRISVRGVSPMDPYLYELAARLSVNPRDTPLAQDFSTIPKISLETDKECDYINRPSPKPRTERAPQGVMPTRASTKPGLETRSIFGSNTSLSSAQSSLDPGRRKKKPAPHPPMTLSPQDSTQSSLASTPCTSTQHSPKLSRSRKTKKAPLPPATSTPSVINNEVSHLHLKSIKDLKIENIEMDNSEIEIEKGLKDELNRTRQSQDFDTNKGSTCRRSKGPAPSRPVAKKRSIRPSPFPEIKHELEDIDIQMQGLEKQGARLEELIREKCEGPETENDQSAPPEVENLILDLFEIINEKNSLFRRQTELMYMRRQHRLEIEHAELEYEIRCLFLLPESNKTDVDKLREDELIKRLCEIVEQRNEIIERLENDRVRENEEDTSINNELTTYSNKSITIIDNKLPLKKKQKKFKVKTSKKLDVDRDIDESETSPKKEKKKKKFNIF